MPLPPIERRFVVALRLSEAFEMFVTHIRTWWPRTFTACGDRLQSIDIEPFENGRVFETSLAGEETDWGIVRACQPGKLLKLTWSFAVTAPTGVTIRFEAVMDGTELSFSHHGWQDGQELERAKFDDDQGWDQVLGYFRGHVEWNRAKKAAQTTEDVVARRTLRIVEATGEHGFVHEGRRIGAIHIGGRDQDVLMMGMVFTKTPPVPAPS